MSKKWLWGVLGTAVAAVMLLSGCGMTDKEPEDGQVSGSSTTSTTTTTTTASTTASTTGAPATTDSTASTTGGILDEITNVQ